MVSDSLFHFTQTLDVLKIILEEKRLRVSYNVELVQDLEENQFVAIPMVCFCDIPLTTYFTEDKEVERYGRYGRFGLGIKKENWAYDKKINPVLYRRLNSNFAISYRQSINGLEKVNNLMLLNKINDLHPEYFENTALELSQIKGYLTDQSNYTKPFSSGDRIYYEAREWRYMPENKTISQRMPIQSVLLDCDDKYKDIEQECRCINHKFHEKPIYVSFGLEDLTHVIVDSKDDLDEMLKFIENSNFENSEKISLYQKLIDVTTIKRDL